MVCVCTVWLNIRKNCVLPTLYRFIQAYVFNIFFTINRQSFLNNIKPFLFLMEAHLISCQIITDSLQCIFQNDISLKELNCHSSGGKYRTVSHNAFFTALQLLTYCVRLTRTALNFTACVGSLFRPMLRENTQVLQRIQFFNTASVTFHLSPIVIFSIYNKPKLMLRQDVTRQNQSYIVILTRIHKTQLYFSIIYF